MRVVLQPYFGGTTVAPKDFRFNFYVKKITNNLTSGSLVLEVFYLYLIIKKNYMSNKTLKVVSLFSGYGTQELALKYVGVNYENIAKL